MIGSVYFIGWTLAAFILPRQADIYGRRVVFWGSMIGHLLIYISIMLSNSLNLTLVLMFALGIFSCGRAAVGFLYMSELLPERH